MKNRTGIVIILLSILISCLVSGGCQPAPGYITVDSRSGLMQPTFCLYRDASLQKQLGIRTISLESATFPGVWLALGQN